MSSRIAARLWLFAFATLAPLTAQTFIPQIADGGGWRTTIVISNSSSTTATVSLSFFKDTSSGSTQSWAIPLLESSTPQNLSVPGGGTLFLHTPGTSAALSTGWAQLEDAFGVTAYAIFTQTTNHGDQDGTADATTGSSRILIPFDNTSSYVTSAALVNPTLNKETIAVGLQVNGTIVQLPAISIPALGHLAFTLPDQFTGTKGQKGMLEFYSTSGNFAAIALRFNPTQGFTTAPVQEETGSPTIVTGGSGGGNGVLFGQNTAIIIHPALEPNSIFVPGGISGPGGLLGITMLVDVTHTKFTGSLIGVGWSADLNMSQFTAFFSAPLACSGNKCNFNTLYGPASIYYTKAGTSQAFASGAVTLTFTPKTASSGTVTGSFSLQGTAAAWGAGFHGTYDSY